MNSESGISDNSVSLTTAAATIQKVEEMLEKVKVVEPGGVVSAAEEVEVKMAIAEESLTPHDQPENKEIDPQAAPEVLLSKEEAKQTEPDPEEASTDKLEEHQDQVKVESFEEKQEEQTEITDIQESSGDVTEKDEETLEVTGEKQPEPEAAYVTEVSKEVFREDEEKSAEDVEAIENFVLTKAAEEPEKALAGEEETEYAVSPALPPEVSPPKEEAKQAEPDPDEAVAESSTNKVDEQQDQVKVESFVEMQEENTKITHIQELSGDKEEETLEVTSKKEPEPKAADASEVYEEEFKEDKERIEESAVAVEAIENFESTKAAEESETVLAGVEETEYVVSEVSPALAPGVSPLKEEAQQAKSDPDEAVTESSTDKVEVQHDQVNIESVEEKQEEDTERTDIQEPSGDVAEKDEETLEVTDEKEQEPEAADASEIHEEVFQEDEEKKEESVKAVEGIEFFFREPEKASENVEETEYAADSEVSLELAPEVSSVEEEAKQAKSDPDEAVTESSTYKVEEQNDQVKAENAEEKQEEDTEITDIQEPSGDLAEKEDETLEVTGEKEPEPKAADASEVYEEVFPEDEEKEEESVKAVEAIENFESTKAAEEPGKASEDVEETEYAADSKATLELGTDVLPVEEEAKQAEPDPDEAVDESSTGKAEEQQEQVKGEIVDEKQEEDEEISDETEPSGEVAENEEETLSVPKEIKYQPEPGPEAVYVAATSRELPKEDEEETEVSPEAVEAAEAFESTEAADEPGRASETVKEESEGDQENPSQKDEELVQEGNDPIAVDESNPLVHAEQAENVKETVGEIVVQEGLEETVKAISEASPAEDTSESNQENPPREAKELAKAVNAPIAVDGSKPLVDAEHAGAMKETVEPVIVEKEAAAHIEVAESDQGLVENIEAAQAEEEVVKVEAPPAEPIDEKVKQEEVRTIEVPPAEYTEDQETQKSGPQEEAEEPKDQSEVAEVVEKESEEILPRESQGALLRNDDVILHHDGEEKTLEISEEVSLTEKETAAEEKGVSQSEVPEVEQGAAVESEKKDISATKEDEEPITELAPVVNEAKDKLEMQAVINGSAELKEEVQTDSAKEVAEETSEVENVSGDIEFVPEKNEEGVKQETEVSALVETREIGIVEGEAGEKALIEELKDVPEAVKEVVSETEEKDLSTTNEDEEPTKELAPVLKEAEDILEKDDVANGSDELIEEVQTVPAKEVDEESVELMSVSREAEFTPEKKVEKVMEGTDLATLVETEKNKKVEGESTKKLAPMVKEAEYKPQKEAVNNGSAELTEEVQNVPAKEVAKEALKVESVSRDVEFTPENKEEELKPETEVAALVETEKHGELVGEADPVAPTEESKEQVAKEEKTPYEVVQKAKLEETEKAEEESKEEAPSKPEKQSNNLISKVKQSFVKAKKAIIGKSPVSKSVPTETRE